MAETKDQVEQRLLHGPGGIDEWINKYSALNEQFGKAQETIGSLSKELEQAQADLKDAQAKQAKVQTTPAPIPILADSNSVKGSLVDKFVSKKFLLAVLAVATFLVNGQYDQALAVAMAYLGAQGAVDFKNAGK